VCTRGFKTGHNYEHSTRYNPEHRRARALSLININATISKFKITPVDRPFNKPVPHGPMSRYTSERDTFSQPSFPQWNPASRQYTPPSLDELKWKLIRFKIPEIGYSYTIDIRDCTSGLQVFEKALRKAKGTISCHADNVIDDDEGLRMYGWGFYMADRDNGSFFCLAIIR